MTAIKENESVSLASFGYDDLGRRVSITRGNGTSSSYGYDGASRLTDLSFDLGGTSHDHGVTMAYNPAGQIVSRTGSNDAYAWTGHSNASASDTLNGLNQIVTTGATAVSHDLRGNMTAIGAASYGYDSQNQLTAHQGQQLYYDPLGRLNYLSASDMRLAYAGAARVAELNAAGQVTRRFVPGPGVDEPLVEYTGAGLATKRWLHADERGSIVALSDSAGAVTAINRYDEYGKPQGALAGRFGYTGQAWLPELGLSYYKARMYNPTLGRFMQTDPIGYGDGMNLYDYVQGDSVNGVDPSGLAESIVNGHRLSIEEFLWLHGLSGGVAGGPAGNFGGPLGGDAGSGAGTSGEDNERCQETDNDPEGCIIPVTGQPRPPVRPLTPIPPPMATVQFPRPRGELLRREEKKDYCGGSGATRHVPDGNVTDACRRHDICYDRSGTSRATCDRRFFLDLVEECTFGSRGTGLLAPCAVGAAIYYGFVRAFGEEFYVKE